MKVRTLRDADLAGSRVLLRVDFNVPISEGRVGDDTRVCASLPTIRFILDQGASVVLVSHLGRPKGQPRDDLRLAPVAEHLSTLLGRPVHYAPDVVGPEAQRLASGLKPGDLLLVENVRFEAGEERNDPDFARALARLGDVFVNDAFGTAHRAHASTVGVATLLPPYAGLLMERELEVLGRLLERPERPFVAILGGAKVSDKLGVMLHLLDQVDGLLVGGGMANTFLLAQGRDVGASLAEQDLQVQAREILSQAAAKGVDLALPVDVIVAPTLEGDGAVRDIESIPADQAIFDIGPITAERFAGYIARAATVVWNGPMGVFERPAFASGTEAVARAVASAQATTVVGGGDSIAAIERLGLADQIDHVSTGGGASLELLEGRDLPGVAVLLESSPSG
ncbi:MAG: phosphoglycerate kinase [Chloroflexota bacterium]|nr:phosphoglycerate kinase [Chloroflexota bacterium]